MNDVFLLRLFNYIFQSTIFYIDRKEHNYIIINL